MQAGPRCPWAPAIRPMHQPACLHGLAVPTTHRAKFQEEIRSLERAKNDAAVEQAFVMDKFRQMKSENDRLQSELDAFRKRLGNATEDYVGALCLPPPPPPLAVPPPYSPA